MSRPDSSLQRCVEKGRVVPERGIEAHVNAPVFSRTPPFRFLALKNTGPGRTPLFSVMAFFPCQKPYADVSRSPLRLLNSHLKETRENFWDFGRRSSRPYINWHPSESTSRSFSDLGLINGPICIALALCLSPPLFKLHCE